MKIALSTRIFPALLTALILASPAGAADDIETAGDVLMVLIPLAGLGGTLFYEDGSQGTLQFFESLGVSEGATQGLKAITDKRRPNGDCCESFPSGHASRAFAGATFIQQRYGWKYALPAYLGATFVAYSRVEADKHFVEDVIAGAAIGIASSYFFTTPYERVAVVPFAETGAYGLNIAAEW